MALSSTTIQQPVAKTQEPSSIATEHAASVLTALVLTVYAAQKSKKQLRKLKRQAIVALFKHRINASVSRFKSLFSKKAAPQSVSNRTLLYILLGLAVLILLFVEPIAAIVLLLLAILLVLLTQ